MSDKLKEFLKEGSACIFESCNISLENTPTLHAIILALFMYTCSDSAMPHLSCAAIGVCLLHSAASSVLLT